MTDFPIEAILDHLVIRIVDVLPVEAAGVTLISPGSDPRYISASDDAALRFERLQSELGEGPCVAAYQSGDAVAVPDLRADARFAQFAPRALAEGLVAVFAFPLRHGEHQLGALDLYRSTAGSLDAQAMAAAQTLADVAAAYLLNAQARAELQDSSERHRENSLHDALTGLANRTLLLQRLDHAIARCRRSGKIVAVLYADLDGFKAVNDTYGHRVGDELLAAVAVRLARLLRPGDTLARLAGDEFAILCEDLDHASQAEPIAARIATAIGDPFPLTGAEVTITASVGVGFAGRGDNLPADVLQDADTAMYQAKRQGGARHAMLGPPEQHLADRRADLTRDLHGAADRGELHNGYRPVVAAADGAVTGVDAAPRWDHPSRGIVPEATLAAAAEQTGLTGEIGSYLLERACQDRKPWTRVHNHRDIGISVKVSARELLSAGYTATVAAVLTATATDPGAVTLEVTEDVFVQDSQRTLFVLADLKQLGLLIALGGFGTGYSSLNYLTAFPFDVVKLDRVLIGEADRFPASRLIVDAVVRLAHGMAMRVVAEGVDRADELEGLVALGCDAYQFHHVRPMTAAHLDVLLGGGGGPPVG